MSVSYVMTAMRNFAHGMTFETAIKSVAETIMLNGPVLPGLGAIFFTIIGKEPALIDMRAPIVLQAIIHAGASALLALAGWRFTGGRLIGLLAGIVLAISAASNYRSIPVSHRNHNHIFHVCLSAVGKLHSEGPQKSAALSFATCCFQFRLHHSLPCPSKGGTGTRYTANNRCCCFSTPPF